MISPESTHQKSSKLEKNCDTHIVWQAVCVEDESRFVTDVTFLSIFNTFAKEALCLIRFLHSTNFLSFLSINIWVFPRAFRSCCVFFEYSPELSEVVVFSLSIPQCFQILLCFCYFFSDGVELSDHSTDLTDVSGGWIIIFVGEWYMKKFGCYVDSTILLRNTEVTFRAIFFLLLFFQISKRKILISATGQQFNFSLFTDNV